MPYNEKLKLAKEKFKFDEKSFVTLLILDFSSQLYNSVVRTGHY